jgi:hypothetical protein
VGVAFRRAGGGRPTLDTSSRGTSGSTHVWIDALTCVEFISSRVGKAYVGVGSAPRGDTAPREKSWERAERAAGGR